MNSAADQTTAAKAVWDRLSDMPQPTLAELFAGDDARVEALSQRLEFDLGEAGPMGLLLDWSKTHLGDAELGAFEELAEVMGFGAAREALFVASRQFDRKEHDRKRNRSFDRLCGQSEQAERDRRQRDRVRDGKGSDRFHHRPIASNQKD